ncbi:MAG: IPT/TIG domain-containing protein [Myxococcota bacterium]|nr:IPT/TIG domain-containing protein [Myxococcota bacterium]
MWNRRLGLVVAVTALWTAGCGDGPSAARAWGQVRSALGAPSVDAFTPASGGVNTTVTVTGSNFTGVTSVRFNGTEASVVTVVSDTQLTARVPAGATTGPLLVSHPTEGEGVSAGAFTIPVSTPPEVTSFAPQFGPPGTSVTLEGLRLDAASVSFNGVPGTVTSNTATQLVVTVPATAKSGNLIVSTAQGNAATSSPFTVVPAAAPTLDSFSPASGTVGTTVTVNGTGLHTVSEVLFNGLPAAPLAGANETRLFVRVPSGAQTGPLAVLNAVGSAVSGTSFTIAPPPELSSVSPTFGEVGTTVTLTGVNLQGTSQVRFGNNKVATVTPISATEVRTTVPPAASSGPLTLVTDHGSAVTVGQFSVVAAAAPTLGGFAPASGNPGTTITVTGANFTGTLSVAFNGREVGYSLISDTELRFNAPAAGSGPIRITNTQGSATSTTDFTLTVVTPAPAPVVSGFSPPSGISGSWVTVTGERFTGATQVTFNGKGAVFTVVSDNQLSAVVPSGAQSGPLRVQVGGQSGLSASSFGVEGTRAPEIHSISPTSAADPITVSGAYFTGTTRVQFNGVEARNFTLLGDGQLLAYLPLGTFGTGKVSVTNNQGTATSAEDYVVLPRPTVSGLSPTSGPPGTVITLTGAQLTNTRTVTLSSRPALFKVLSDTQLEVTVPRGTPQTVTANITTPVASVTTPAFTVTGAAAPQPTGMEPRLGVPGTIVYLYGRDFSGATAVSFNGAPAASFSVISDGWISVPVPPAATTGPVGVSTSAGTGAFATAFTVIPAPLLTGFSPTVGEAGTPVTLSGSGFTATQGVTFKNRTASFTVVSDTQLIAYVPSGAVSGPITVSLGGTTKATSGTDFTVQSSCVPVVEGLSPDRGGTGNFITVSGRCFTGLIEVRFNGKPSTTVNVGSDGSLSARVPAGAGTGPVSVVNSLGTGSSVADFTYVPTPVLAGFSPSSGGAGTVVTLGGTALSTTSSVQLNNRTVAFSVVSDGELTVTVPLGASTGTFRVNTLGGNHTPEAVFTVLSAAPPTVTGFSPGSGAGSSTVVVDGTNFTGATAVRFGGVPGTNLGVQSDTRLSITVPGNAPSGPITVVNTEGAATSAASFTVIPPPGLFQFSPERGTPGDTVTLEGSGFSGATAVRFSGSDAEFTVVNDGRLTAIVPPGAVSGSLSLQAPGGYAGSSRSFTVLSRAAPVLTSLTPGSGAPGSQVMVEGQHFTGLTGVTFNGRPASFFSVVSDTQVRAYPPADVESGPVAVTNTVGTAVSSTPFLVLAPTGPNLSGFAPSQGAAGTVITLSGSGLSGTNRVRFNTQDSASFTVLSDTEVTAVVPLGASSGKLTVFAPNTATSADSFTVLGSQVPTVTGFTPSSGGSQTRVTVQGTAFTGVTRASIGGLAGTNLTVFSDTSLSFYPPPGATTGPISVLNSQGEGTSADSFLILPPPEISSFSPAGGPVGTVVTVTGSGFTGATVVRLGKNTQTVFTVDSDTQLTVVVPPAAVSGTVGLATASGSAFSVQAFTVLSGGAPTVTGLSPSRGASGAYVLLTGTHFVGLTGIGFNGVPAARYTVHSDTHAVAQVPYGATSGPVRVTNTVGTALSAGSFTVDPGGTLAGFSPAGGPAGTVVTVTGAGLTGTRAVSFAGGLATFTVQSDSQLAATVPAGAVTGPITVEAPGGLLTSVGRFAVPSASAPQITGLGPSQVGVGGTVTVWGQHFAGVTEVRINDVLAESFVITSDQELRAVVATNASSGVISVTNNVGTAVSGQALTVIPPPSVLGFTPSSGAVGSVITVTGSGFTGATGVSLLTTLSDIRATFTVVSDTQLTFLVPEGAGTGRIRVSGPGGRAHSSTAFVTEPTGMPVVTALQPSSGDVGTLVLLQGAGLGAATGVQFNGQPAEIVSGLSSDSVLYAVVPSGATTGKISVTNALGTGLSPGDFTVSSGVAPTITSVSPNPVRRGQVVTVQGARLLPLGAVQISGAGSGVELRGATETQVQLLVPPDATSGYVYLVTSFGGALAPLTVEEPPAVHRLTPSSVQVNQGTTVTVRGAQFRSGATVRFGGVAAGSVTFVGDTELTVVPPVSGTPGRVDVEVSNPGGLQHVLREGFAYLGTSAGPTLASVTPNSGPAAGGTSVTITGTGLVDGATVSFGGIPASAVAFVDATTLSCTTPALPPGATSVTLRNPDGQLATLAGGFTAQAPPAVASVSPVSGSTNGGTAVTINGSGFLAGASVTFGGVGASVTVTSSDRLTAVTGAHPAGAVDVIVSNTDGQSSTLIAGYSFVAPGSPTVSAISPATGPSTGGTPVTITGTNFVSGAEVSLGGVAASWVTFLDSTRLTAVTGAHAPGAVNVDVSNPDGSAATLSGGFVYQPEPGPSFTGLSPTRGPTLGGTVITLSGGNFKTGATVLLGGTAGTVETLSPSQITVTTPARGSIGAVDVVVTNPDAQSATRSAAFTYDWGAPPAVTAISPSAGPAAGGTAITLTGTGFVDGATVTIGTQQASSVSVLGPTQLTAITAAHPAGTFAVVVRNTDQQTGTLNNAFTYQPLPVLTVTSVSPGSGPSSGGNNVTVGGTNFASGATVRFGAAEASAVTWISDTSLSAEAPPQATGTVDVTVTNPDSESATLSQGYLYLAAPAPTLSAITPDSGSTNGGTLVTINGANFVDGVTVRFDGVEATAVVFGSDSSITATTPVHAAFAVEVVVTNPDGQQASLSSGFTYLAPPAPSLTSVTPAVGPATGGTSVTLDGANFVDGATVRFGEVEATGVVFGSATSLTAQAPGQPAGTVTVTVTNPDGQTGVLAAAFTYQAVPAVTLGAVNPASGSTNGGTDVTLTGTGFAAGATVRFGGVESTQAVVASESSISARAPAHPAGAVDVSVHNPDGSVATLAGGFTYLAPPAPVLSSVSPSSGAMEGGLAVSLTGANFVAGATVTFGGTPAAGLNVASDTAITAITPPGASGTVEVRVTHPDGQFASLASGFTYEAPAPASCGGCASGGPGLNLVGVLAIVTLRWRRRRGGID